MEDADRRKVVAWFRTPRPDFPVVPMVIGTLLALPGLACFLGGLLMGGGVMTSGQKGAIQGGLSFMVTSGVMGVVPVAIGLGLGGLTYYMYTQARQRYENRISDEEVDAFIDAEIKKLDTQGLHKTGLDEADLVGESVVIQGPRLWNVSAKTMWRQGHDGVLRYSPIGVTIINFTAEQVVAYSCALDLTSGKPLNESTDEYFYGDIVSVSTKTKSETYRIDRLGQVQLNAAETFTLTTSGGTSVEVVLRDPGLIKRMGGGEMPTTRAEKAVQTIRKMLREKKSK